MWDIKIIPFEVNHNLVHNRLMTLEFPVYEILQIKNNKCLTFNLFNKGLIFKVFPSLKNDIYDLYYYNKNENKFVYYDTALVNDYHTSKFMNNIFGFYKKENYDIDCIEMSDSEDEDEFDNLISKKEKIIESNENYFVKCIFNKKFKKWKPIEYITLPYEKVIYNKLCASQDVIK